MTRYGERDGDSASDVCDESKLVPPLRNIMPIQVSERITYTYRTPEMMSMSYYTRTLDTRLLFLFRTPSGA